MKSGQKMPSLAVPGDTDENRILKNGYTRIGHGRSEDGRAEEGIRGRRLRIKEPRGRSRNIWLLCFQ
jgi:hypothetical protein